MRFLTLEEVLRIHARVMMETPAGLPRHSGVRHVGSVQAALERAQWGPFESGDLAERAALLLRGIAMDHPFEDGNKRTALACAFAFLDLNAAEPELREDETIEFMLEVARGEHDLDSIAAWLRLRMPNV
jgi:death on curing protein